MTQTDEQLSSLLSSPERSEDSMQNYDEAADRECAEFQSLMPERIGAGEDLQTYPHMLTCERCRALVSDLEYIAEFARQLIPKEEEPSDKLWDQIKNKLDLELSESKPSFPSDADDFDLDSPLLA